MNLKTAWHVGDRYSNHKPAPPMRPTFHYRDQEHTPSNKRPGSVDSVAVLEVEHYKGVEGREPWLNINLEEITTTEGGRVSSRNISVVIKGEALETLKRMIACDEWKGD